MLDHQRLVATTRFTHNAGVPGRHLRRAIRLGAKIRILPVQQGSERVCYDSVDDKPSLGFYVQWTRQPADKSVKLYHLLLTVLVFFVADRALALLTPDFYRAHTDRERIINEYHTRQFVTALRRHDKVEALVIGDSRARYGVDPAHLTGPWRNTAHNLAIDGAGVTTYAEALPHLLRRFPQVSHVFWGISPRVFNVAWKDNTAARLTASAGYQALRTHCTGLARGCDADQVFAQLLSAISKTYAQRSVLQPRLLDLLTPATDLSPRFRPLQAVPMSPHGYMRLPDHALQDTADPKLLARYRRAHKRGWFKWNEPAFARFKQLVTQGLGENVTLLLFIPPMHATLASLDTADHDATPDGEYGQLVKRLAALANAHPRLHFVDLNNDGANTFTVEQWGNFDHLNHAGARVLAQQLSDALNYATD